MQAKGYWVKRSDIYELNAEKHIDAILHNPDMFGITVSDLENIYMKHGEKWGVEGKAREEIIRMVAKDGWIRVRHYTRPRDYWSIQYDNFRRRKKDIQEFVFDMMLDGNLGKTDELQIMSYNDDKIVNYSFIDGGANAFLQEHRKTRYKRFKF